MNVEGSCSEEMTKTWGFRRSTIARREFIEAVCSVESSPLVQRQKARRGRGRGRGKQAGETSVISQAFKRGRGGRGRERGPLLTSADKTSSKYKACLGELKSPDNCISEGIVTDETEDSDDLNLQEIRERAVARQLQELKCDIGSVKEDMKVMTPLLLEHEDKNIEVAEIALKGGKVSFSKDRMGSGNSVAVTEAQEATGGGPKAKRAKKDNEFADEHQKKEETLSDHIEDGTDQQDWKTVCCTCQQRPNNRLMICCDSCRKWHHVDCVGITEACGHVLQSNGEKYVCAKCSERDAMRRDETTVCLYEKDEISTCLVGTEQLEEENMQVKEKADSPKCIGPGCGNDALPESVYCGHQCIVQHAAVAMKSLSDPKIERKSASSTAESSLKSEKRSFLAKLFKVKINKTAEPEEHINNQDEMDEQLLCSAKVIDPVQPATSSSPATDFTSKNRDVVECNASQPQSQPSDLTVDISRSKKNLTTSPIKKSTPGRAKKTMTGSPRLELLKGALGKSPLPCFKKSAEYRAAAESRKPPEFLTDRTLVDDPVMAPQDSPLLIRQNIRHSLSKILLKRLNQHVGLNISENETEKLATDMEKEMFNMCYTTDEEYKNKYQYLILSLNDPQNKELLLEILKGNMPSVRLIQMSQEDMTLVKETAADPVLKASLKEASSIVSLHKEPPMHLEKVINLETKLSSSTPEEKSFQLKQTQAKKIIFDVPEMISSMLKDTTSEHKHHVFDLNCVICTGQGSTNDDPENKTSKMKTNTDFAEKEKSLLGVHMINDALDSPALDSNRTESPASPTTQDVDSQILLEDFFPVLIPSVPLAAISGRDPRTAQYQKALSSSTSPEFVSTPLQHLHPAINMMESSQETQLKHVSVHLSSPMPKSILMKPSPTLDIAYGSMTRMADCDKGTRQFLSKQNVLWKGFLNMPTVAKFVTKGYLISGSSDFLKEDLPDTIHIGGRILPQTVWEYVDLIKTSEAKELSLIRFHPSSEEEEVAYVSLFSYFNSRRRFGVVSNVCKRIKDLYLIPLCTKQSLPAVLLPIEGPGLEQNHPNLLIGLAVCQKLKRPEGAPQDVAEKQSRSLICSDVRETNNPSSLKDLEQHNNKACDADVFNSSPCGFLTPAGLAELCPASPLCNPSSLSSVLSLSKDTPSVSAGPSKDSTNITPLQTILHTLFGQKTKQSDVTKCKIISSIDEFQQVNLGDDGPYDPEDYDPGNSNGSMIPLNPEDILKPKVLFASTDDDDDRPYDPEEEYNAAGNSDTVRNNLPTVSDVKHMNEISTVNSDIAYDPEDETIFEEMQNYLTGDAINVKSTIFERKMSNYKDNISTATFSEQQKLLEELNRQIEEQKRQLEEQTETLRHQKEAIGFSLAHFSVSNTLLSPPTQFGMDEEEESTQKSDPLKKKQDMTFDDAECGTIKKETTQKLLKVEETKNVVLNKSLISKKENSVSKQGSAENAKHQNTNCSYSQNTYKKGRSRKSMLNMHRSSRKRSWHEHRSYHHDRTSSRTVHTIRASKYLTDKQNKSRQSTEHLSRESNSDRKREASRKRHHHRRYSSSPLSYRNRCDSAISYSRERDKCLQDNNKSCKTERQEPVLLLENSTQFSQQESGQVPGDMQSAYISGQSVKVQDESANYKEKKLAEVPEDGSLNTKCEAGQSHGLHTLYSLGEDCSQSILNHSFDKNQSEMKNDHLPPCKIDLSSKQVPLLPRLHLHSNDILHGDTDLPLNRVTPILKPFRADTGVLPYVSINSSAQPQHKKTATFSEPGQINQKRGVSSIQRLAYLHNDADKLHSEDYPQRDFHSEYRNVSQAVAYRFYCRELPQDERRDLMHDTDYKSQPSIFLKQEHTKFYHQKQHNHMQRRFSQSEEDQVHQNQQPRPDYLRECSFLRPDPRKYIQPSAVDECKPLREHPSFPLRRLRSHTFSDPRDAKFSTLKNFGNRDQFSGLVVHEDPLLQGPDETFASNRPAQATESKNPSPGPCLSLQNMSHKGSCHVMQDKSQLLQNSTKLSIPNIKGPSQRQIDTRDSQIPRTGKAHMSHFTNPNGYPPFQQFYEEKSVFIHFSNKQTKDTSGQGSPQEICELQSPNCPQLFEDDAEDRVQRHAQDSACMAAQSHFEGQQYTEIKGPPKGLQKSEFRKQKKAIVETGYGRDHKTSSTFEGQRRQTTICPLRLSGPLLPTPPGGPVKLNISHVHRHMNVKQNDCERSQALFGVRQGRVTKDISGPWIREEKGSSSNSFKLQKNDGSKHFIQTEQAMYECRQGEPSVQDSSYGQFCRSKGRHRR